MRVLVFGMVGTQRGGIETFLLKMNAYMSKETIFDYVIEEKYCIHEEEIASRGGQAYYITARTENPFKNLADIRRLLKQLDTSISAVYFNLSSLSWIEPIRIAKSMGYRVYVHAHNAQFIDNNSYFLYRIVNKANKFRLGRYAINRLTCSKPCTEFMFNVNDDVKMIYNAVDVSQYIFDKETRVHYRNLMKIDNQTILFGFVGRLQYQKNPDYLVKIITAIRKITPQIKLIIIGEGEMEEELRRKFAVGGLDDCVEFLGRRNDVNCFMQAMDYILLPSHHEGLPFVIVEAQAAGLKCLLSNNITKEVDYTGNVRFLDLTEDANNWALMFTQLQETANITDRMSIASGVKKSSFNIQIEAKKLESILAGK